MKLVIDIPEETLEQYKQALEELGESQSNAPATVEEMLEEVLRFHASGVIELLF